MAWNVLILGGGFGGLYAARKLERALPPHAAKATKAVAEPIGIRWRGFPAWFLARTYHLAMMPLGHPPVLEAPATGRAETPAQPTVPR